MWKLFLLLIFGIFLLVNSFFVPLQGRRSSEILSTFFAYSLPHFTVDAVDMLYQVAFGRKTIVAYQTKVTHGFMMNLFYMLSEYTCNIEMSIANHATQFFFVLMYTLLMNK